MKVLFQGKQFCLSQKGPWGAGEKIQPDSSQRCALKGQETKGTGFSKGNFKEMSVKSSSHWVWSEASEDVQGPYPLLIPNLALLKGTSCAPFVLKLGFLARSEEADSALPCATMNKSCPERAWLWGGAGISPVPAGSRVPAAPVLSGTPQGRGLDDSGLFGSTDHVLSRPMYVTGV